MDIGIAEGVLGGSPHTLSNKKWHAQRTLGLAPLKFRGSISVLLVDESSGKVNIWQILGSLQVTFSASNGSSALSNQ